MDGLQRHGITSSTTDQIWLGAGTIHKGLTFDSTAGEWNWAESLIAATQGGSTLTIEPEILNMEIDGANVKTEGLARRIGETATLETNLVEITPEIMKWTILGEEGESEYAGYKVLESSPDILPGHYVPNLAYIGHTLSNKPIVIVFKRALCSSGLAIAGAAKENTTVPATFECYNEITDDLRSLSYRIYYPEDYGDSQALASGGATETDPA